MQAEMKKLHHLMMEFIGRAPTFKGDEDLAFKLGTAAGDLHNLIDHASKPQTLTVEMIVARGWQIWINGEKPKRDWVIGENGEIYADNPRGPVDFGSHKVTKVALITENGDTVGFEDEWDEDGKKPAYLAVHLEGGEIVGPMKITFLVYGSPTSATELLVTTLDGKTHDIDEITTYIRAEVK